MLKKISAKIKKTVAKISEWTTDVSSAVIADVAGSDTTEKIGMVVVAVVIVGLLAVAVRAFMPNLFTTIGNTAKSKLTEIFG